jgi:hypothetical protein
MPANYVLLERIELNASAASVTFANIPQTGYTDLKVVASVRSDKPSFGFSNFALSINGSTANLSTRYLEGSGSAATSGSTVTGAAGNINGPSSTANVYSNTEFYFPNYTSSNNKSWSEDHVTEANATTAWMDFFAGLWSNTAAITSITFTEGNSSTFSQYSTFSLYGLAAVGTTPVIAPKAAGGNRIDYDGTYYYHVFNTNGTFTPQTGITADVLVVAGGGGGGGGNNDGAGGAGGLLGFSSQSLTATSYTCTVGAGGVGTSGAHGLTGGDSQFGALTLVKGGGGGGSVGYSGGSGGGNGFDQTGAAGAGTSGQGFAGGPGQNSGPDYWGGGGGGSAEAGNTDGNGHGGDGVSTYSSWGLATGTGQNISGTVYYAGGGSGAGQATSTNRPGGDGGGGRGAGSAGLATAGTVNTGGGGGSGGNSAGNTPGSGGSGIIIIRYLAS